MLSYLVIINSPAMNIGVHVPFQVSGFFLNFGYISRYGIGVLYGSSILSFWKTPCSFP